ncbi:MAG: sulfate/thiosulfate transport system permease protein [Solirubrobacteraceae bacterium]|nr:sulfate/thiosulfate transport system permease protein [Solirubrobacteraceae bacterium]
MHVDRKTQLSLRVVALAYLAVLLLIPVIVIFGRTFEHGIGPVIDKVTTPAAISAFWLTIEVAAIAVVLNAIFGIATALVLVRTKVPGRRLLDAMIDMPFAVSPVVIGLALVALYGRTGWFGPWLEDHGIQILFSFPGILLATVFVSLPFVVREVAPVLREIGDEQEQAAATLGANGWQTFWRITLPAIRWGLVYGVVLSVARAIGEFGAVSFVSGKVAGETQTLTILVEQRYTNFDVSGAYAAAALLAVIALVTLLAMTLLSGRRTHS